MIVYPVNSEKKITQAIDRQERLLPRPFWEDAAAETGQSSNALASNPETDPIW